MPGGEAGVAATDLLRTVLTMDGVTGVPPSRKPSTSTTAHNTTASTTHHMSSRSLPKLIRAPPVAILANAKPSSDLTSDYSASIPDPPAPPSLDCIAFERDERPRRNSASLPRHSPLPAARPPMQHSNPPCAPETLYIVEKPHGISRVSIRPGMRSRGLEDIVQGNDLKEFSMGERVLSFVIGVIVGLIPVFIVSMAACGWPDLREKEQWDERWMLYGRSVGLLVLITVAIVIVVIKVR